MSIISIYTKFTSKGEGVMENISDNPTESLSENNELLQKAIEGMQLRKQSMLSSLQTDALEVEKQKDVLAIQIGHVAYSAHKKNKGEQNSIETEFLISLFSKMEALDTKIDEINREMTEISECFEEEVEALTKSLGEELEPVAPPAAQPSSQTLSPPAAQQEPVPVESVSPPIPQVIDGVVPQFTLQSIPEIAPQPAQPTNDSSAGSAMFCSECGTKYTRGIDNFCENCGSKLE